MTLQQQVYLWLGFWRDKMPTEAVKSLQDLLGDLSEKPAELRVEDLSMRDYFAGQALTWLDSDGMIQAWGKPTEVIGIAARIAYEIADAMLTARDSEKLSPHEEYGG